MGYESQEALDLWKINQHPDGLINVATEEEGSVALSLKLVLTGNEAVLFRATAHRAQCTPDELLARIVGRLFDDLVPVARAPSL